MKNKILRILCWIFSFVIMAGLFYSSSRSLEESRLDSARFMEAIGVVDSSEDATDPANSPVFQLHIIIRKQAHFFIFLTFGVLLFLSVYGYAGKSLKSSFLAWSVATLYGVFDEVHQGFSGRGGPSLDDIILDSKSALIGVLIICIILLIIESYPKLYALVNKIYNLDADLRIKNKNEFKKQAVKG